MAGEAGRERGGVPDEARLQEVELVPQVLVGRGQEGHVMGLRAEHGDAHPMSIARVGWGPAAF
jgi:hypothetical protein